MAMKAYGFSEEKLYAFLFSRKKRGEKQGIV